MSTMRNSVMLIGRPGAEPEIRNFKNNNKKATFRIAVNESRKNANGEWVENTPWFPVVGWNNIADRIERHVRKGMLLAIDGSLQIEEWTDDKGQRHSVTRILVSDLFPVEKTKE